MTTEINLNDYRWWTFAKTEDEAQIIIRQTHERNAAPGLPLDRGLAVMPRVSVGPSLA